MSATPVTAYVGLGANLGDALAALRAACVELDALPGTRLDAVSRPYRSAPVGVSGEQPDYVNAVARIETTLPAHDLLEALLAIEARYGRTREYAMAPRTLDLDLLLYADARIDTARLRVPHPRLHQRAFVLAPLAELAPGLAIPGAGTVRELLPTVAGQAIEAMDADLTPRPRAGDA